MASTNTVTVADIRRAVDAIHHERTRVMLRENEVVRKLRDAVERLGYRLVRTEGETGGGAEGEGETGGAFSTLLVASAERALRSAYRATPARFSPLVKPSTNGKAAAARLALSTFGAKFPVTRERMAVDVLASTVGKGRKRQARAGKRLRCPDCPRTFALAMHLGRHRGTHGARRGASRILRGQP